MKSNELLRKIQQAGWYEIRQEGSHKIMANPKYPYTISFPFHGSKEVGKGMEMKIKKQAGIK